MKKTLLIIATLILFSINAHANYVQVSNVSLTNQSEDDVKIEFDITWNNSWYNDRNHDAAWVFVKYSADSGTTWHHVKLATEGINPSDSDRGEGILIDIVVPPDKVGAFIKRTNKGAGTLDTDDIQLAWDYKANSLADNDTVKVKVFALEMAYIPQGSFYVGDGASEDTLQQGSSDTDPWYITNSNSINVTSTTSNGFYYMSDSYASDDLTGATFTIPFDFPNGYDAFYLMKHEMSQGLYRDFLNMLTLDQQNLRTANNLAVNDYAMTSGTTLQYSQTVKVTAIPGGSDRNTFVCDYDDDDIGDESDDGEWKTMGMITMADMLALADWSGLRPYTSLEFEKACRGVEQNAVASEYAWGTTSYTCAYTTGDVVVDDGKTSEGSVRAGHGLTHVKCVTQADGPYRSGFAATEATDRAGAGAGYYGHLDLTGNNYELMVAIGNTGGRSFKGTHGDGELVDITGTTYDGNATNTDWPGISADTSQGVVNGLGLGVRGGDWTNSATGVFGASVSNRNSACNAANYVRTTSPSFGARFARTAPDFD